MFVIMRVGRKQVHGTTVEQPECHIQCGFTRRQAFAPADDKSECHEMP